MFFGLIPLQGHLKVLRSVLQGFVSKGFVYKLIRKLETLNIQIIIEKTFFFSKFCLGIRH